MSSAKKKVPHVCNFIKKETPTQMFSSEFCEIFYEKFFILNTSGGYFWPLFSGNNRNKQNISFIISNEIEMTETFNEFFPNVVPPS